MINLESLPFKAVYIKVFSNRESIRTCYHVLLNEDFKTGRFNRSAGESLCRRKNKKDDLGRPLPLFYDMEFVKSINCLDDICLKCAKKLNQYCEHDFDSQ